MIQAETQSLVDTVRDTAVVHSPLPGGVGAVVRFLMNVPTWIQIGGAVFGAVVAVVVLRYLWRKRLAIWTWLTTRSRGAKLGLAGVAFVVVAGLGAFSVASWNYIQHNNDFCVGCHVMTQAFSRFQHSEHRKLQCHDCHQQSLFASARQLVLWVAEKPQEIPKHAKVPNDVCAKCHIQKAAGDSVWKRIVATAGHRVHLNSSAKALKNVQCVTCHGQEVHHFAPVDSTCGQSQCHAAVPFKLGKMNRQTTTHCVKCHAFTRGVSETISLDSARLAMNPTLDECLGCHDMKRRLGDFDVKKDPHQGVCGLCHNPHKQATPAEAWTSCAKGGCHARAEVLSPFHRGIAASALAKCASCHKAHSWTVKGDMCLLCHKTIYEDRPPGTRAAAGLTPAHLASVQSPPGDGAAHYTGSEFFSHRRHQDLACTNCHATGKQHGALTVRTARDCQSCHHTPARLAAVERRAPSAEPRRYACTVCHSGIGLRQAIPETLSVKLTVWKESRSKVLAFRHDRHAYADCAVCHSVPVTMGIPAEKGCLSCHAKHHAPDATCRSCHVPAKAVHQRDAHLGCAGSQCHAPQELPGLEAKRNVCLVCHSTLVNHKPGRECAACHQVKWLSRQKAAS